jgi:hypothetical protein
MSVRFGIFVPQGWRMDLVEIADPVEQYEAMTAVAWAADAGPGDSCRARTDAAFRTGGHPPVRLATVSAVH